MPRTILALAPTALLAALLAALLVATGGCRSCANPYDYCGPLAEGGCQSCSHCGHEVRSGSILGGADEVYEEEGTIIEDGETVEAVEEEAMTPQPDPYAYQQPKGRAPRRIVR